MTILVDEMRKQLDLITEEGCGDTCCGSEPGVCNCPKPCDCGPKCPCHVKEDNVNENDVIRMKELAGMTEEEEDPIEDEELDEKLERLQELEDEELEENGEGVGRDGKPDSFERNYTNPWEDKSDDDDDEDELEEDGYDYREMGKPEPNDFDRSGMDFDAFAKKGHTKKQKKIVNKYGDNPMTEETDDDGNWVKPWEAKDKDDNADEDKDEDVDEGVWSGAAKGAALGAAGAAIIPAIKGAATGGALGGIVGAFDDDEEEEIDESIDNALLEQLLNEFETFKDPESDPSKTWTLMNSTKKMFGKLRVSIEDIVKSNWFDNGCIMVVNFDHGPSVFVMGSGNKPYGLVGESRHYVQDTGKGMGRRGSLEIENFVCVQDSEITSSANSDGQNEKRPLWVFK